jgi:hypothetical protein
MFKSNLIFIDFKPSYQEAKIYMRKNQEKYVTFVTEVVLASVKNFENINDMNVPTSESSYLL